MERIKQQDPESQELVKHAKVFRVVFGLIAGMWIGMVIFDICIGRYNRIFDHVNIAALCGLVAYLYHKVAYLVQIIMDQFDLLDSDYQVIEALGKSVEDLKESLNEGEGARK